MRIIGGTARGRLLTAPPGMTSRPTGQRAREALFSILQGRLGGAAVLDVFAGSGALGLEALSRGALAATFWDCDARAVQAVRQNLARLGFEACATVQKTDSIRALAHEAHTRFDLIFLDPPYQSPLLAQALPHVGRWLADGGVAVAETDGSPPAFGADLVLTDTRRYGANHLYFFEKGGPLP